MGRVYRHPLMRNKRGDLAICIDYTDMHGKRHRYRTEYTSEREAEKELALKEAQEHKAELLGLSSPAALEQHTFAQFVEDEYLPHVKATRKDSTYLLNKSYADTMIAHFGGMKLRSISTGDIQRFFDKRISTGKTRGNKPFAPATINRERAFMSAVFYEAVRRNLVDRNPVVGVKKLKENNSRVRYLSDDEREKLLNACPEWLRKIVSIGFLTGLRLGNTRHIRRGDVDRRARVLRVPTSKTGKELKLELSQAALDILTSVDVVLGPGGPSEFVFADPDTIDPKNPESVAQPYTKWKIQHALKKALTVAGISDFHFHDLRHDFASMAAQAGVPLNDIRDAGGWTTLAMVLRYAHLSPTNRRAAAEKVAAATGFGKSVANLEAVKASENTSSRKSLKAKA